MLSQTFCPRKKDFSLGNQIERLNFPPEWRPRRVRRIFPDRYENISIMFLNELIFVGGKVYDPFLFSFPRHKLYFSQDFLFTFLRLFVCRRFSFAFAFLSPSIGSWYQRGPWEGDKFVEPTSQIWINFPSPYKPSPFLSSS